jgi:hypothetical protein
VTLARGRRAIAALVCQLRALAQDDHVVEMARVTNAPSPRRGRGGGDDEDLLGRGESL